MHNNALKCGWKPIKELLADSRFPALIEQQWRELTHLPDSPPMPDWVRALEMERVNALKIWTAYLDRTLVGFIQFHFMAPLGYPTSTWAIDGGWYFAPEKRNAFRALAMWREAEEALRKMDVDVIRSHDNIRRPLPALFKRLGYQPVAQMFQKVLD